MTRLINKTNINFVLIYEKGNCACFACEHARAVIIDGIGERNRSQTADIALRFRQKSDDGGDARLEYQESLKVLNSDELLE